MNHFCSYDLNVSRGPRGSDTGNRENSAEDTILWPDWATQIATEHRILLPIEFPGETPNSDDTRSDAEKILALELNAVKEIKLADGVFTASNSYSAFIKIGAGSCGVVFSYWNNAAVAKLQRTEDLPVWNDYIMHTKICDAFHTFLSSRVRLPGIPEYFEPGWDVVEDPDMEVFPKFSELADIAQEFVNLPTPALIIDRILPVRKGTRDGLVELYAPPALKETALEDDGNTHCLIRLYLGKVRGGGPQKFFSLQNYKLHLNQMEKLKLDIEGFADKMGRALAIMHWAAKVDARNVEFVLGSARVSEPWDATEPDLDTGRLRDMQAHQDEIETKYRFLRTEMFLLDFNLVRDITMDDDGIELAVEAFMQNDPYYPRPNTENSGAAAAWNAFVKGYLDQSSTILYSAERVDRLAVRFLKRVMEEYPRPILAAVSGQAAQSQ